VCCSSVCQLYLQLIGRKAGGKDLEEIAALGTTMGKLGDVLLNAAAGLLSAPNAQQVSGH
jgi:hypothetical protein